MSAPSATARYVIAAEDKSGAALQSIIKGFKGMDKDIRGTLKTLNTVIGVAIGVQLTHAFRKVLDATAAGTSGQQGFARALREVRDAAGDLLTARSGLPEATARMQELRDVLKDPTTKAAVDVITSSLISGFSKSAKFVAETVAGLRELAHTPTLQNAKNGNDVVEALNRQIGDLRARKNQLQEHSEGRVMRGDYAFDPGTTRAQVNLLEQEIARLEAIQQRVLDNPYRDSAGHGAIPNTSFDTKQSLLGDKVLQDDEARRKKLQQDIDILRTSSAAAEGRIKQMLLSFDQDLPDNDALAKLNEEIELIDLNAIRARKTVTKELSLTSEYAKEAARNIQDAFANFLFDPFQDGLKGMLRGFVDVVRRMLAEMASAKVFGAKSSGGLGLGGFLSSLFGGSSSSGEIGEVITSVFPKYASGTDYVPRTGLALVHKGERITPAGQNRGSSGMTFAPVYNIDARGATMELAAALPAILRKNNEQLKSDIIGGLSNKRYVLND